MRYRFDSEKKSDHILRSRPQFSFFMSNFLHVSWTMTLNWRLTHPNILFLLTFLQTRVGDRSNFHVSDKSLQKPAEFGAYHQHLHSVIVSYWNKSCHPIWIGLISTQKIKTPIPEISSSLNATKLTKQPQSIKHFLSDFYLTEIKLFFEIKLNWKYSRVFVIYPKLIKTFNFKSRLKLIW